MYYLCILQYKVLKVLLYPGRAGEYQTIRVIGLSNDISPYTITQWTGHSSLAAMKPYMAIADKEKKNAMKKSDEV